MRRMMVVCSVLVMAVGMARAQDIVRTNSGTGSSMSIGDAGIVGAAMMGAVENKPYQAEKTSRTVQKLADGTVITVETHGLVARSSTGQMREDIHSNVSAMTNGRMLDRNTTMATAADPAASTITMWQTGDDKSKLKTAMVMQLPNLSGPRGKNHLGGIIGGLGSAPPPGHAGTTNAAMVNAPAAPKPGEENADTVTHEDLGRQSIEGVLVKGKRTTTVIPVGKIGNDRPITITDEIWTAPELGIVVKQIDNDPRTGERTMELTGLTKTEPDAALFHAPADYTMQDMSEMMKKFGDLGKKPSAGAVPDGK